MHSGFRPPGTLAVRIAFEVAVIPGIGVDKHGCGAVLLRHEALDPSEILAIADDHDLAPDIDLQLFQLLEIFRTSVIRVNNIGLGIARRGGAVERHEHPGIVLKRIIGDMLAGGTVHLYVGGRCYVHADLRRAIHPHFVLNHVRLQPGFLELPGNIVGGLLVLGRSGNVWLSRQNAEMLFCAARIGHGDELLVPLPLLGEIPKAENLGNRRTGILLGESGKNKEQGYDGQLGVFQSFPLLWNSVGETKKLTL